MSAAAPKSTERSHGCAEKREDDALEASLRPKRLAESVGQRQARENLAVFIEAARARNEALDHVLFSGPPGLGKTTLAQIVARELGVNFRSTSGPVLAKAGDLAAILTNLEAARCFVHRRDSPSQSGGRGNPVSGDGGFRTRSRDRRGPGARSVKIALAPFTLVGATTRSGLIT